MTKLTRQVIDIVEDEHNRIVLSINEYDLENDDESIDEAADRLVEEMGPGVYAVVRDESYEYQSAHRSEYGSLHGSFEGGYGSSCLLD